MPLDFDLKEGKGRGGNYFFQTVARPRIFRHLGRFAVFPRIAQEWHK